MIKKITFRAGVASLFQTGKTDYGGVNEPAVDLRAAEEEANPGKEG